MATFGEHSRYNDEVSSAGKGDSFAGTRDGQVDQKVAFNKLYEQEGSAADNCNELCPL
jgi:hypothetical protein